jgi:hypothetical protein
VVQRQFWRLIATGISTAEAALTVGVSVPVGSRWLKRTFVSCVATLIRDFTVFVLTLPAGMVALRVFLDALAPSVAAGW